MTHICQASGVGAKIETGNIPIALSVKKNFGAKALGMALSGGEDYELLFTGDSGTINKIKAKSKCPVTVIGTVVADHPGQVVLVDPAGENSAIC